MPYSHHAGHQPGAYPRAFNRHRLPDPAGYYAARLNQLKPSRPPWAVALCPFHEDRHPSFSVNMSTGGYFCHGCGAKGGDVLAFHRQLTGQTFKQAAYELGAWQVQP